MAFDYGSIDLGIRNPFRKEGTVTAVRGGIAIVLGVFLLLKAAAAVSENAILGWILVIFGLVLLGNGIRITAGGIIAVLRYFVGRNHPTSLAANFSRSEASTAKEESGYVAYTRQTLTEMLFGRKNATFVEPHGFLARSVHSVFPSLTYMPYPIRNMAQRLFGAWVANLTALVAYALVAFVSVAGFAGEVGKVVFPVYAVVLTLYLLVVWRSVGASLNRTADRDISGMGGAALVRVIGGAIVLPVLVSLGVSFMLNTTSLSIADLKAALAWLPEPHTLLYLTGILLGAIVSTAVIVVMLRRRLAHADPKAEVSELRENWQESVHPKEIFINLDNLVMANRRYKEVPNRVYQELEPYLDEQVEGKGNFRAEMIQEIQPKFSEMDLGSRFRQARFISLLSGNLLYVVATILMVFLAFAAGDAYLYLSQAGVISTNPDFGALNATELLSYVSPVVHLILAGMVVRAFARTLANAAHLFFAEMQFESQLIYVKMEGTFTESRISTGTGIHDSTRSENTLVRSSITPWVIVTRLISSTFAATGMRNLEHPRFIMEMHKDDAELAGIRRDVVEFLKDRESIASITSERDLRNASQIHGINQQSRAVPMQPQSSLTRSEEEAAGYLRNEEDASKDDSGPGENDR